MATKLHCDVCDAVIAGRGDEVEVKICADDVELRGFIKVKVRTSPGIICHGCVHRLFVEGAPTYAFPHNKLIRNLNGITSE